MNQEQEEFIQKFHKMLLCLFFGVGFLWIVNMILTILNKQF